MTAFTVTSARAVGGAAQLESLALAVFGAGDRTPGWFARKLARECVDDDLSSVAVIEGADPRSPRAWLGYVLVGAPPSLAPAVRTAGTGVRAQARGRGIGRALLERVHSIVMQRGGGPIELLADPRALAFYLAFGFTAVEALVTMRGEGHGRRTLAPAAAWSAVHGARSICAWTPEAWAASDGRASITDARDLVRALVSREGTALLVQRWCTDAPQVHDAARELADAVPAGVSWLVPWLADVSPVTAQLYAAGLQPVQRAVRLHLARKHDASSDRA